MTTPPAPQEPLAGLVPLRRPHFEIRGGLAYFLISGRPHAQLDHVDQVVWDSIDGHATVADLEGVIAGAEACVHRFLALGICEVAPADFPRHRRRILVIEPHMDDAALSVGGRMWALRNECEFTVATIASRSNFTSYHFLDRDFFDVPTVSSLRAAESAIALRLLGGHHVTLGESEAPLRFRPGNWSLAWYRRHRKLVDAFIGHSSTDEELATWAASIERLILGSDAEEIWLPLGVGSHTDHELAREACLRAIRRRPGLERQVALSFYEEVPYSTQFPGHTEAILSALTAAGATLDARRHDISTSIDGKLRLVSLFGSQFKPGYMIPRVLAAARQAAGPTGGLSELTFALTAMPAAVDPVAIHSARAELERVMTALVPWYDRHRSVTRVRILSPVPIGRWKDDMSLLLSAFPHASFEVHGSSEYAEEAEAFVSPRITQRIVFGRERAWLARLCAVAIAPPAPTILLTGEALRPLTPIARAAFFRSDPLIAPRMHHVIAALRRITSS